MDTSFIKAVEEIESQISVEYIGGCIDWADTYHDHCCSRAIDQLHTAIDAKDPLIQRAALMNYEETFTKMIKLYKEQKNVKNVDDLRNYIEMSFNL